MGSFVISRTPAPNDVGTILTLHGGVCVPSAVYGNLLSSASPRVRHTRKAHVIDPPWHPPHVRLHVSACMGDGRSVALAMHLRDPAASNGASAQHELQSPWSRTSVNSAAHIGHCSTGSNADGNSCRPVMSPIGFSCHLDGMLVPADATANNIMRICMAD